MMASELKDHFGWSQSHRKPHVNVFTHSVSAFFPSSYKQALVCILQTTLFLCICKHICLFFFFSLPLCYIIHYTLHTVPVINIINLSEHCLIGSKLFKSWYSLCVFLKQFERLYLPSKDAAGTFMCGLAYFYAVTLRAVAVSLQWRDDGGGCCHHC